MKEDSLTINGDFDYLKRIFQNLYGNSKDAMPKGGTITIECFSERKEGSAGTIIIRFSDTGTGIPQEIMGKIFDPFFTTKKPGKGTGLGLALVQRIVSLHNGRVLVEKSDTRGTTFRIEIPEIERYEPGEDTRWILSNRIAAQLLLLDDDKKIRDVLKFFLKEFGYQICEATDLDTATTELKKNQDTAVVIMDWKLGSEDPHHVIRSLRAVKKDIMVLVVSGYPPNSKSIDEMKIFRWFTKPYDKNQLDLEIQRSLHTLSRRS
jgi:two-component system, cell cycle sensor histidine kinase and response regulator CckA